MEIDVEYELVGGTAKISGTLAKDEVEFLVQYGLFNMLKNGALPVTEVVTEQSFSVDGDATVN